MTRTTLTITFMLSLAAGAIAACESGTEAAALCGAQECPVGTAFSETRTSSMTYNIEAGFNAATYDAEGSFASFGSGSCEYFCSVIQACPDGTFPVITADCFTCGVLSYDSENNPVINQGSCDGTGLVEGEDETGGLAWD